MCPDPHLHKWTEERKSEHLHFSCKSVKRRGERGVIDPADPDQSAAGGSSGGGGGGGAGGSGGGDWW